MRYLALACDFDGTIATDGLVDPRTVEALGRVKESGRRLLLVSGRELEDLGRVFSHLQLFDRVVAENGALIYTPSTREQRLLGEPAPPELLKTLAARGVSPLAQGRVIVATSSPHEATVVRAIHDLALERQIVFNKGSVMILPSGVNKGVGLQAALDEMGLSVHNVVGVGDAENDHAFLATCELSVAVANALPLLKGRADIVTSEPNGAGVRNLIEQLLRDDFQGLRLPRHALRIGVTADGREVTIEPASVTSTLLAGPSQGGKSTLATTFLERLAERGRQFCIIDPEGDYVSFEGAVSLGTEERPPAVEEVLQVLQKPGKNVAVNLIAVGLKDRPAIFESLLSRLLDLRAKTGRPDWLIIDEAHHVVPASRGAGGPPPQAFGNSLMITLDPARLAAAALESASRLIVVGVGADACIDAFRRPVSGAGGPPPSRRSPALDLPRGEAVVVDRAGEHPPIRFTVDPPASERRRHHRKYAEGELAEEDSFYFRGPQNKLQLRAPNLRQFLELADGVDEDTWLHHLRRHDYSRWFRANIKDEGLAEQALGVERQPGISAHESRDRIREAIEERYSLAR